MLCHQVGGLGVEGIENEGQRPVTLYIGLLLPVKLISLYYGQNLSGDCECASLNSHNRKFWKLFCQHRGSSGALSNLTLISIFHSTRPP